MSGSFRKKFVILTEARTGSNALVSALTQHPDIHCDYEVFHPLKIYTAGNSPFSIEKRETDPISFLDAVIDWNHDQHPNKGVYGFKLFFAHSQTVQDHLMADPSWAKIVLRRENLLDQFTSERIAHNSAKWNSDHGKAEETKVDVKISHLEDFLQHSQANFDNAYAALENSGQPYLDFEYCDVAKGRFDVVCDYLKVDGSISLTTHLEKQNSPRSADRINNVDEVKNWLSENDHTDWWVD